MFPGFSLNDDFDVAFERDAGYLLVEECIRSFISLAVNLGADVLPNTSVLDWSASSSGIEVHTSEGPIQTGALILAGGPWASSLLGNVNGVSLALRKKHMYWYSNDNPKYFESSGFPVFACELPSKDASTDNGRVYYGFPQLDSTGVKLAEHTGGVLVDTPENTVAAADPEAKQTDRFRRTYLPHITGEISKHESCLYTVSHDENFYLDSHPEFDKVAYVAGLSGHGFKFAPILGEVLADLVTNGNTAHNIEFLRANVNRFD